MLLLLLYFNPSCARFVFAVRQEEEYLRFSPSVRPPPADPLTRSQRYVCSTSLPASVITPHEATQEKNKERKLSDRSQDREIFRDEEENRNQTPRRYTPQFLDIHFGASRARASRRAPLILIPIDGRHPSVDGLDLSRHDDGLGCHVTTSMINACPGRGIRSHTLKDRNEGVLARKCE